MPTSKQHILEKLETYKDLFHDAHDLIHLVEPDGQIMYVNTAWEKRLGYSLAEVDGRSIYSYVYDADRSRFTDYRNRIVSGDDVDPDIVVRMISKDGNIVYVEGLVSSKTEGGKALYTRGIFRDITARLQSEAELKSVNEQLREKEANLQQLLFHAPDAVIVADTGGKITYWNPKAESIFGWKESGVVGRRLAEVIIPRQYRTAHEEGMKRYLETGEGRVLNRTMEVTALNKRNEEFYVALTISSTIQNGAPAFIAFIRDIDQQKRNALELERNKAQLEVSNQQLEQFAHVASHDMKEPIRKILLLTELVQTDDGNIFSDSTRKHVDRIERSASRLSRMVDGVLAHSSIKSEALVFEKVSLNEVAMSIESDLELALQQKEAVLNFSNLPWIEGAPFLIYQLFYNLILNSLKFTKPGVKPVIEITAAKISPDTVKANGFRDTVPYYEIVLKDNGIGFQQDYAEIIFKAFSRLHNKDKFEGTGLGLALCKTIVEKHKGVIDAYGEENVGAAFHIILPEYQNPHG